MFEAHGLGDIRPGSAEKETGRPTFAALLAWCAGRSLPNARASDNGDMPPAHKLVCAECGRQDPGGERGCTIHLDVDDQPVNVLPECDRNDFGDG